MQSDSGLSSLELSQNEKFSLVHLPEGKALEYGPYWGMQ